MKLLEIFRFELTYRMRTPSTWIYLIVFLGLSLLMVEGVLVQEARGSSNTGNNFQVNAPFILTMAMVFFSMIGMVVTAGLFSDAAVRDYESRMHPLFFTSPISKSDYLGGRFLGALAINTLLLICMPIGLIVGLQLLEIEPSMIGPFRLEAFVRPFFFVLLPNMFITAAILTTIAVLSRRALASYAVGLLLFLGSLITAEELLEQSALRSIASLIEPFGFLAIEEKITYWTPMQRNNQLIDLSGAFLWNRLLWIAGAFVMLAILYVRFRFGHETDRKSKKHHVTPSVQEVVRERIVTIAVPKVMQVYSYKANAYQILSITWQSFKDIFANKFLLFLAASTLIFLFINGWEAWVVFDTPTWPVTYVVAREILGQFPPLVYILIAFFAGELIWRERESGVSEINDAMALPNWVTLLGKFGALVLALISLQILFMAGGISIQVIQGYYHFELGLYVKILLGIQLADYVLWAALAVLVHVLINQKYMGHMVFVLYYVLYAFARYFLGIEHYMLLYPDAPGWSYSDISGFDPFLAPYLWFKLYWATWAVLLLLVANLFWNRGRENGFFKRIRAVRNRFTFRTAVLTVFSSVLILVTGGFVFYNTNVLNEYQPRETRVARVAQYEQLYKRYEHVAQPRVAGSSYHVEIYPEKPAVRLRGSYLLQNKTAVPIDTLHLQFDPKIQTKLVDFDRKAEKVLEDNKHGYRIYNLKESLQPGDSMLFTFELAFERKGFTNQGVSLPLAQNATYLDFEQLPSIGYQAERELKSDKLRGENGLSPRKPTPSVHDEVEKSKTPRYGEWINTQTIIGTSLDQTAVAPGRLRRTWTQQGRRYFHYQTDVPVKNVQAFFSAKYAVYEDNWKDIPVQIYHHPNHSFNLENMVRGVKASLDYYTTHFGPYRYQQLRIVEFPRHEGHYARAFPGTVAYSESMGFMARVENGIDYPFVVTAHEVAHQWWGGQFAAAEVQGRRVLHETLAHYSALMVMEKAYGAAEVRKFLSQFRHRYLVGRQNRGHLEVPLYLSDDQDYIHYDKGAVVMYALRDYVGEEKINTALRRFLEKHKYSEAPYPTTIDLLKELKAVTPDSLQYLLTDLFEEITVWDMRTEQALVKQTGKGTYQVTLKIEGTKMEADSIGRAQKVPMHDFVEIGVFSTGKEGEDLGKPLYLKKHRIKSGMQFITVTVPHVPARAGIDPYHKLIEWTRDDNIIEVSTGRK